MPRINESTLVHLSDRERSALRHALEVAGRTFHEHVEMWGDAKPNVMINENGIKQMRALFTQYWRDTVELLNQLDGSVGVAFLMDDESESRC